MRNNQEDTNAFNTILKSGRYSHARKVLTTDDVITLNGPLVNFLDPNGSTRIVTLPVLEAGRFYVVSNIGTVGNLTVQDVGGVTLTTLLPKDTALLFAGDLTWAALRGWAALGVFTNTVNGLVPAPVSAVPGSLFLRDDMQWGQVQVTGIVDAFKFITDGTTTAIGSGPDTFRLRSSTSKIGITVQNNDATFGDNANFTVNEANVNHNALLNYVADQHVAHSGVVLNPGTGMSGGGDITVSRTLNFNPHSLTVNAAPVLTDYAVMDLAAGGPRTTLFSSLNSLFIHNNLAGYVANEHINHTGVSIVAGAGISGGGDITTSRTIALDINGLASATPAGTDTFPFYNAAASGPKKLTLTALNGLIDHNALTNYVANQHIDHTAVSISTGTGLTGGGTIAATRTLGLASITNNTVLGNVSGSAAAPIGLTQAQLTALINTFTSVLPGAVPASGGGTTTFLRADGTFATVAGTGTVTSITDHGLTITTSGTLPPAFDYANATIAVSAAAGALTITINDNAGSTPSATSPLAFVFRNSTAITGSWTQVSQTSALSLVLPSSSTLGITSAKAARIWIVVFNDAGTLRLGAINCTASANQIFPLNESGLASSTAVSATATAAGVFYTGVAVTSKAFKIIGYVEWNATGMTAGTWTTTNLAAIQSMGPGVRRPGDEVQSVHATSNTQSTVSSLTLTATTLTVSITPTSAANPIEINASGGIALPPVLNPGSIGIGRGTTTVGFNARVTNTDAASTIVAPVSPFARDLPNTIASTTYNVIVAGDGTRAVVFPSVSTADHGGIIRVRELMG